MPQLHCYIPKETANKLHLKAEQAHLSVSKYLAKLIQKDLDNEWPEGFFDLFGSWQGDDLVRLPQGDYEDRETLL